MRYELDFLIIDLDMEVREVAGVVSVVNSLLEHFAIRRLSGPEDGGLVYFADEFR